MTTKLGLCVSTPSDEIKRFVQAGCPLITLADNFEIAAELRALRPNLLIVGRAPQAAPLTIDPTLDAQPAAQNYIAEHRSLYEQYPAITVWEGPRPLDVGPADNPISFRALAWYADFEAERLRLLAELNLKGVVGNFAPGTPDLPLWVAFIPALDAVEKYTGFLGLREQSAPFLWSLTGAHQVENCTGETAKDEGDTGWATLRYRKIYRQYLEPNGLGQIPLLITECGVGKIGLVCEGQSDGGWRAQVEFWNQHTGARDPIAYWRTEERNPERYYTEQLRWYLSELSTDSFVAGAALYAFGSNDDCDVANSAVLEPLFENTRGRYVLPPLPEGAVSFGELDFHEPETATIQAAPSDTPKQLERNLLTNAGFESGQIYYADNTHERAVPQGWTLTFADSFARPMTLLINSHAIAKAERARVFAGGAYAWKVCGTNLPLYARLAQMVSGLTPGQRYIFAVNVLPDLLTAPGQYAETTAGEIRLTVGATDSEWRNGEAVPFGHYSRQTLDFVADAAEVEVALELRTQAAFPRGAWYVDELSLSDFVIE